MRTAIKTVAKMTTGLAIACICYACSTQATISGRENSTIALTNSYNHAQYDGCFWIDLCGRKSGTKKRAAEIH